MRTKNFIVFVLIAISAGALASQNRNSGTSNQPISSYAVEAKTTDDKSTQVDSLMARWSRGDTPGAAIIVIRDGRALLEKGYGLANLTTKESIGPKTIFDIGSVSKQFTAMALMILVERGKLNYSDKLSKFFPELQSEARQITLRHLLNHSSGIFDYTSVWGESAKLKGSAPRTSENVVRFLAGRKLLFPPGQRWEYSNSNYVLLAQIVSIISGESFPQFVRKNIFQPLGMNDSFVYEKNLTTREGLAKAYVSQGDGFKPANRNSENYVYGDGQVNTTVEDMAKWDQSLYTETLVKTRTLNEAFVPGRLNDGTLVSYGFGWGLGEYHGLNFVAHGGGTDGYVAQITRFPEQHFSVILLSNCEQLTPQPYAVANKIASIYLAGNLKSPTPARLVGRLLSDYVGEYALYDLTLKITLENSSLWLRPPGQKRVKLELVSEEEFTTEGSNGDSSIKFNRNSQGKITCLTLLDQNGIIFFREK